MSFKISRIQGAPVWDSLPVAVLTKYPWTNDAYRPFTQAQLCVVNGEDLIVRLWSFENDPVVSTEKPRDFFAQSCISFFFTPPGAHGARYLALSLSAGGETLARVCEDGASRPLSDFYTETLCADMFAGENLQGEFWGGQIALPAALFEAVFGVKGFEKGHTIQGNLYKTCGTPPYVHFGCYFDIRLPAPEMHAPAFFGAFEIVDY